MSRGIHFQDRWVPFPASISEQARAALESLVGPDGVPLGIRPSPDPDDFDAWVERKAQLNRLMEEMMAPAAEFVRSSVETRTIDGVTVHVATPADDFVAERAYLEFHGGALIAGAGLFSEITGRMRADQHGVRTYSVDYRTPPEDPYPAALDDGVTVYRALVDEYSPGNIIVGGSSAGGNLAAATVLRARDEGLPLPAAAVLMTPELDLTESGDSFATNAWLDVMLKNPLMPTNLVYAAGADLADPYLSPLFGDFTRGFPPTLLQAGTRDLFLSNAVRMHKALRTAGVEVELHVCEGMPHGGFGGAPEDLELAAEVSRFVAGHWAS